MAQSAAYRPTFTELWSVEIIRLKEAREGPLVDEAEVRRARSMTQSDVGRICIRAQLLCQRLGYTAQQHSLVRRLRWVLGGWILAALMVGAGMAHTALVLGGPQVNVIRAWFIVLGIPTLGLIIWLIGGIYHWMRPHAQPFFAERWRWVVQKIGRGADTALLVSALVSVFQQQRLSFWWMSCMHHLFWVVALLTTTLRLWFLLAFQRYYFQWESTLFDAERFVQFAQWASAGLRLLGVSAPDAAFIRLSDGLSVLPPAGHALWASWLLASVLVYGLLPRVIALGVSGWVWQRRVRTVQLDMRRSDWAQLRARLSPDIQGVGIDAPSPPDRVPVQKPEASRQVTAQQPTLVVGMELAPDSACTQEQWPDHWRWWGAVDDRAQRQALLSHLQAHPPSHLIMLCDGRQTPDRGLMAWLVEVAGYVPNESIMIEMSLVQPPDHTHSKQAWRQRLEAAGLMHYYFSWTALYDALAQGEEDTL